MKEQPDNTSQTLQLKPYYHPFHIGCYQLLSQLPETEERADLIKALLSTKLDASDKEDPEKLIKLERLQKAFGCASQDDLQKKCINALGFSSCREVFDKPIDSINFDIADHYKPLREAVLSAIAANEVPVIVGGTDSLDRYAPLLHEDMKHSGIKSPILLISSMRAFGEDNINSREHVSRLMTMAYKSAAWLAANEHHGVIAMTPDSVHVNNVNLLDAEHPLEKISGELDCAIIGHSIATISRDGCPVEPVRKTFNTGPVKQFENNPRGLGAYNRIVLPPIKSYTNHHTINRYLEAVYHNKNNRKFDALIINNIPDMDEQTANKFVTSIKGIVSQGKDVYILNDRAAKLELAEVQLTEVQEAFKTHPLYKDLEKAGVLFRESSSAKCYMQAAMDEVHTGSHIKLSHIEKTLIESSNNTPCIYPLVIKYMPDAGAAMTAMHFAHEANIPEVIVNAYTHGSLPEKFTQPVGQEIEGLKIVLTFKYAGQKWGNDIEPETADVGPYAAAAATNHYIRAGGSCRPEALAEEVCEPKQLISLVRRPSSPGTSPRALTAAHNALFANSVLNNTTSHALAI